MTILLVAYSALLVTGGLIAFLTVGSLVSLVMSTAFALSIIATLFIKHYFPFLGYSLTYTLLGLLTLFFTYRAFLLGKFFPPGVLALISLAVLLILCTRRKT